MDTVTPKLRLTSSCLTKKPPPVSGETEPPSFSPTTWRRPRNLGSALHLHSAHGYFMRGLRHWQPFLGRCLAPIFGRGRPCLEPERRGSPPALESSLGLSAALVQNTVAARASQRPYRRFAPLSGRQNPAAAPHLEQAHTLMGDEPRVLQLLVLTYPAQKQRRQAVARCTSTRAQIFESQTGPGVSTCAQTFTKTRSKSAGSRLHT
jgi:hypothetical protein